MFKLPRAAFVVGLSSLSLIAVVGSGVSPAFGEEDNFERTDAVLLPASVIQAALDEGQTPADLTIIPETQSETPVLSDSREAGSLSDLVASYSQKQTIDAQAECLAGAVYFEAKGEPLDGQLAVAKVIVNRAKSGRFPSSICGVVKQPSQFSFIRGGAFPSIARDSRNWRNAVAIAHIAQEHLWDSSVNNALYFHAKYVSPSWRMTRIASIGNHIFYR